MGRRFVGVLVAGLSLTASSVCAQFWQKKEHTKWDQSECGRMMNDSPWARAYSVSTVEIRPLQSESDDTAREARPTITYLGQFRSALPVRQALVRLGQLSANYDQKSGEERAKIDQQAAEFLNRKFDDAIVVYVSFNSNVVTYQRQLISYWQSRGPIELSTNAYLITQDGKKISPLRVQVGEASTAGFQLVFPRLVDGRPALDAASKKSIAIEFPHPNIGGLGEARVLLEFKPNKMVYHGSLTY